MKGWIMCFYCCLATLCWSQESNWTVLHRAEIKEGTLWEADRVGNTFLVNKDLIQKMDTSGRITYAQSIKSLGRINSIYPINALKIFLFSEEQQTVAFTDNTLSSIQSQYNLGQYGFQWVTLAFPSAQANKIWVYDQLNSSLTFLDMVSPKRSKEIENLKGLLTSTDIVWLQEHNNYLYLRNNKNQLFVFDFFGSLVNAILLPSAGGVEISDMGILHFGESSVQVWNEESRNFGPIDLPGTNIVKAVYKKPFLTVQSQQFLHHYKYNLENQPR